VFSAESNKYKVTKTLEEYMTTTITRLKQIKAWIKGSLQPERVQRQQSQAQQPATTLQLPPRYWADVHRSVDRFASYREKIMPKLRDNGYAYFLACDSNDYQQHQEWCHANCEDYSLAHCDVWQCDSQYPRAFANQVDAVLFCLSFDAIDIEGDQQ